MVETPSPDGGLRRQIPWQNGLRRSVDDVRNAMNQTAIGKGWTIFRIQLRRRAVSDGATVARSYAGLADNPNIDNRFAR